MDGITHRSGPEQKNAANTAVQRPNRDVGNPAAQQLLRLQRWAGNAAVARAMSVQRKPLKTGKVYHPEIVMTGELLMEGKQIHAKFISPAADSFQEYGAA